MLDHQADGAFEIGVAGLAALERAPPDEDLGVAATATVG